MKSALDIFRWFAFGIIAFAVLLSYYPTLYYPPRADQVTYLAETANKQRPWDLILGSYDLNRNRVYAPGDELLFRPLVYILLGSEQLVFGHNFWAWQLFGILAHLTLVWVMLRLLWYLSGPGLAFAGTWLFALSVSNYELVSWPHLTSYILMMVFIILTIEQVVFCFEEKELGQERIRRMVLFLTIACFIYETANLFALCIMASLMVFFPKNRIRAIALVVPVLLYSLFSFYNYVYVNHLLMAASRNGISIGKYLWSVVYVGSWWLYEGLFNGLYGYVMDIRTMFRPDEVMVFKPLVFNDPQVVLGSIILLAFGGLVWINRRASIKRIGPLIVLGAMLLVYVAVIVPGRYEEMGGLKQAVRVNSHYLYLFWAIVVMMAFSLIATKEKYSGLGRGFASIFVIACLMSGAWQGKKIYSMASVYSRDNNNSVLLVTTLDLLIRENGHEPNFSFYVHPQYPGNLIYREVHKKADPSGKEYSFAELLYPQYFRPEGSAKYKFLIQNPSGPMEK